MSASDIDTDLLLEHASDPEAAAAHAGLHYVRDDAPGLTRRRSGSGFAYVDEEGAFVTDEATKARVRKLAIPPAYTEVWISRDPKSHLQATGRDDKGRKQYVYHPDWEAARNEAKFNRLLPFGEALPEIRSRYDEDLGRRKLSREKVLAVVAALLDRTLIRVGNDEYARSNGSYGLTTLRDRHVDFEGTRVTFAFEGKSGKAHEITLTDRRLADMVRRCRDIPGYDLFQYYDAAGERHDVTSADVNAYLQETTGQPFTAKDFRTWGGTVHAAVALAASDPSGAPDKEAVRVVKEVAERLGNTPAVCRSYYVHPALLEAHAAGTFAETWMSCLSRDGRSNLAPEECALLHFLRDHLSG